MGRPIERAMTARGHRIRVYTPYGAMLPGMAYLVRRLLENTSNESFLKASSAGRSQIEELLTEPRGVRQACGLRSAASRPPGVGPSSPFRNEPLTDFTRPEARAAMTKALARVRDDLASGPYRCPVAIDGAEDHDGDHQVDHAPGDNTLVVSRSALASAEAGSKAVDAARRAFDAWATTPVAERAECLIRAPQIMQERRFELTALEVFECGKPWREADGDVAEAIDFCEFYAREMVRLDRAQPPRRARRDQRDRADRPRGGRRHPPLELPPGDPLRDGRRRLRRGQLGRPQAGRAVAAHGLAPVHASSARPASRPACSTTSRAGARSSARPWWITPRST